MLKKFLKQSLSRKSSQRRIRAASPAVTSVEAVESRCLLSATSMSAAQLDVDFELEMASDDFENWGGAGEKWLWSGSHEWLFITPDGGLFDWDGGDGATGELLTELDSSFHSNLVQLVDAASGQSLDQAESEPVSDDANTVTVDAQMLQSVLQIDAEIGLELTNDSFENWGGRGEKWLWSDSRDWFFVTPDGSLFDWDGGDGASGDLVAELLPEFHANLSMLAEPSGFMTEGDDEEASPPEDFEDDSETVDNDLEPEEVQAQRPEDEATNQEDQPETQLPASTMLMDVAIERVDQMLSLNQMEDDFENWGGIGERWLWSGTHDWVFLTPAGDLYDWDGSDGATGEQLADLPPMVFDDITTLANAAENGDLANVDDQQVVESFGTDSEPGEDPHADTPGDDATVLELADGYATVSSYIDRATDVDVFVITPDSDSEVYVSGLLWSGFGEDEDQVDEDDLAPGEEQMDRIGEPMVSGLEISITNQSGEVVETVNDWGVASFDVLAGESYFITVSTSADQATGEYWLDVSLADEGHDENEGPGFEADSELGEDLHSDLIGDDATVLDQSQGAVFRISHIDTAGDVDVFTFTTAEAGTFVVGGTMLSDSVQETDSPTENEDLTAAEMLDGLKIEVLDAAGEPVMTTDEFGVMSFEVAAESQYFARVSAVDETAIGTYAFALVSGSLSDSETHDEELPEYEECLEHLELDVSMAGEGGFGVYEFDLSESGFGGITFNDLGAFTFGSSFGQSAFQMDDFFAVADGGMSGFDFDFSGIAFDELGELTFSNDFGQSAFQMDDFFEVADGGIHGFDFDFDDVMFCGVTFNVDGFAEPPVDSEPGEDPHGDTASEATQMDLSSGIATVRSYLDSVEDVDVFSINLSEGGTVVVSGLLSTSDVDGDEKVTDESGLSAGITISVVDSDGANVGAVEDGVLTFESIADATYFVSVSSEDGSSGQYYLTAVALSEDHSEVVEADSDEVDQEWMDGLWEEGASWMEQLFLMG